MSQGLLLIGIAIAAVGYLATIVGAIVLVRGAPEPHAHGTVPVGVDAWKGVAEEAERLNQWKKKAPWAQAAIIGGSSLQLVGTILSGVSSFK